MITQAQLNFQLLEKIGTGGEGDVYIARDFQLNANLAIKKIPKTLFNNSSQFFNESKKLYLTMHQNVVQVNYGCSDSDFIYLAMPLYKNGALNKITDSRFLSSKEIIRYSLQFLSGLNHVHAKGLVHFDVKLENILLSDSNQALISDFGLAQYTSQYGFARVFGTTPIYAPPELFQQAQHNLKFDIYQAGLTMYRMCIGDQTFKKHVTEAHKFRGVVHQDNFIKAVIKGQFPNRSFYYQHIPKPLRTVIQRALNTDPNKRYSSIIEMLNDLAKTTSANDWIFESDYSSYEKWTKPNYEVLATSNDNGTTWEIRSTKNSRQTLKFCKKKLNNSAKNTLLYTTLNSTW